MVALAALPCTAQDSSTSSTSSTTTGSDTTSTGADPQGSASSSDTSSLGQWWDKSSISYDPVPTSWLFHLEGTLGYQRLTGNTNGRYITGTVRLAVRKDKITLFNNYNYADSDVDYGGDTGTIDLRQVDASLIIRRDLLSWLYVEAGQSYEIDDPYYIDRRDTTFAGIGTLFEPNDSVTIEGLAAGGWQSTDYSYDDELTEDSDTGWSVGGRCTWKASDWLTLDARGQLWKFNEEVDGDRQQGDRSWYTVTATIPLSTHFSLNLEHKVEYEDNWLVRATDTDKKDTTQTVGIKLSI